MALHNYSDKKGKIRVYFTPCQADIKNENFTTKTPKT